jgi:DNA repair exonuclease SbcCD ATPase subunit
MLTDEQIEALLEHTGTPESRFGGRIVHELCTRLLNAEEGVKERDRLARDCFSEIAGLRARVKVLEEALPKALDGLSWSQHHLREADVKSTAVETALEAVRTALQEPA